MNKIGKEKFDYSIVDGNIGVYLKGKAYKISEITSRSAYEIGKELKDAQDVLAKNGYGIFEEWYRSLGFKKTESYQYINHYLFVSSESEQSKIEMFESAPKSIQVEISKPSAKTEVNEAYFKGDIKTHKEYKEQERIIKEQKKIIKEKEQEVEQLQNKEAKVIKEPYIPDDYQQLEEAERRLKNENRRLSEEVNNLKESLETMERTGYEVNRMQETIKQLDRKKAQINNILDANDKLTNLEKEFHEFFDANMSPLKYKPLINDLYEFNGTERMKELVNLARAWVDDMDRMLPSENRKIIEGEIIND